MNVVLRLLGVLVIAGWSASTRGDDAIPAERPIEEVVDRFVDAKLSDAGAEPAPQADDATLIRRLTLDLVGRVPTSTEAQAFLASNHETKRVALVDRLLRSKGFVGQQASELDTMLTDGEGSIADYLRAAVGENRPWDRIFREILLADRVGDATKEADAFIKARARDTDRLTNDVSVRFFGINVSCAQCHDHPYTEWTQDHYYGMKAFFNRTFENGGFVNERSYGLVSYKTKTGESRTVPPRFLVGKPLVEPESKEPSAKEQAEEEKLLEELGEQRKPWPRPQYSRRARLVEEGLKPGQVEYFARAIVNRVWHRFFAYGLVMPLDQMHAQNPPSHPELLDWLARNFVEHGYDLRRLVRGLVLSNAYSRSSLWEGARPPPALFAVAIPRPLSPRQYAQSLRLATLDPAQFAVDIERGEIETRLEGVENEAQAMIGWFEQPQEGFQVNVDEALVLSNGEHVQKDLLNDGEGRLVHRLIEEMDPARRVERAVWTILSRPPTEEESRVLVEYLMERKERPRDACQQLVWILLTGTEFRFNY